MSAPQCFLVQLPQYVSPVEIFTEYAYFSSYSSSWVEHARLYTEIMRKRLDLTEKSFVVEVASNDGYLLQHFVEAGIPVLGIEPAANVAEAARAKRVPTRCCFFGVDAARDLVRRGEQADLLVGNNVLAQVPDLNDFVAGLKVALKPTGVITMEFPHLMQLMEGNQFDTIYHEHFSYFSFLAVERIFAAHGLTLFDVDEIPTHGGSLRIYARHAEDRFTRDRTVGRRAASAGKASGLERLARLHGVRRTGQKHQAQAPGISDCRQTERQVHCRLWCARQRQYASELLRDSVRFPRLHGGPQPVQAPQVSARDPHRDFSA